MGNYENARGKQSVAISIAFTILGNLIVVFRLINWQTTVKSIGSEDWCCFLPPLQFRLRSRSKKG
jgi:hypothetical protein